jgi:hypothetical protein
MAPRPRSSESGNRCPYVSIVSVIVAWLSLAWITFGFQEIHPGEGQPKRFAFTEAEACAQGHGNPVAG